MPRPFFQGRCSDPCLDERRLARRHPADCFETAIIEDMRIADKTRARVYDAAIVPLTASWYRAVIDRLPERSRVLDVGIGTGAALTANAPLVVEKNLHVTGIDVDAAYVEQCRRAVARAELAARVDVRLESVYDHRDGPYDAIYFSASFMLLPDPVEALRHVCGLLRPEGRIYFTQTFEHERSRLAEVVKPLLRLVTTIDFGRVTYEADFQAALESGGVAQEAAHWLDSGKRRASRFVVARPICG
jgi:SAM-dependent methyltransferase